MFKKALSTLLVSMLLHLIVCVNVAAASSKAEKEIQFARKVKASITRLGVGEAARVEVKLRDKTKVAGYVSEAGEDSFVVTNAKTDASTMVAYANVAQVKGQNLSRRGQIILTVAVAVGIVVLAAIFGGGDR